MTEPAAFWKIAQQRAEESQARASYLQREILNLEAQTAQKKAALHAASLAHERLANYEPILGRDFQCPICWIEHETRSALRPMYGGTRDLDLWRCGTCDTRFDIPFGG
jgi:DNA repair exonuclease SbcCD ATPase subunit